MTDNECFYCGAKAKSKIRLEKHHPLGGANSPMYVLACLNCHNPQTRAQNSLPPWARKANAPSIGKLAHMYTSLGAHLKRLGEEMERKGKKIIEDD